MAICGDFHTHSLLCDGGASLEDMALAAAAKGMEAVGFSGHGYTYFDESYCMSQAATKEYCRRVAALKESYASSMRILCGVERDYYSHEPFGGFDYVIGSVHYVKTPDGFFAIDEGVETLRLLVERYFGGDWYALAEEYYRCVADVVRATDADIIGHFDLIAKYNGQGLLFDESSPRYVKAWQDALDALVPYGKPFEINTAPLFKGLRSEPYPRLPMLCALAERGGSVILSSDSHCAASLCFGFEEWREKAESLGLRVCSL